MDSRLKTTLKTSVIVFALAAFACWLTGVVALLFGITLNEQPTIILIRNAHGLRLVGLLAWALLLAPACEELLFRWILFKGPVALARAIARGLGRETSSQWPLWTVAAVLSSIVFVAAHYGSVNPFPDNAFIGLFIFAIAQCRLYVKTSRLWCPMLNHFIFNMVNIVCLYLAELIV